MGPDEARNQEKLCRLGPAAIYWTGLGVNLDHPVTEGHKYRDLVLRVWGSLESERVKYDHESRDSDARMTALARTSSNCKRQTRPRQRGRPTSTNPQFSDSNKILS
jgi:hypothetical protein